MGYFAADGVSRPIISTARPPLSRRHAAAARAAGYKAKASRRDIVIAPHGIRGRQEIVSPGKATLRRMAKGHCAPAYNASPPHRECAEGDLFAISSVRYRVTTQVSCPFLAALPASLGSRAARHWRRIIAHTGMTRFIARYAGISAELSRAGLDMGRGVSMRHYGAELPTAVAGDFESMSRRHCQTQVTTVNIIIDGRRQNLLAYVHL